MVPEPPAPDPPAPDPPAPDPPAPDSPAPDSPASAGRSSSLPVQAPPPVARLPTPGSSYASTPAELDGFAEFMELGDAAPGAAPAASAPEPLRSDTRPLGQDAAAPPQAPPPTPATPTARAAGPPPASSSPPLNPVSFLTGLFSKATTTLESTLQQAGQARQGVATASSSALSSATENLSAAGTNALSSVSGLVAELSRSPSEVAPPFPPETTALKLLHADAPARFLLHNRAAYPVVLAAAALHAFPPGLPRRAAPLGITWSPDGAHAVSTPPPPSAPSPFRPAQTARPVAAVCAVHLPDADEVLVAHEDGALRVFSADPARLAVVARSSAPEEAVPACACLLPGRPGRVALGCSDGSVRVVDAATLRLLAVFHPPDLCSAALGAAFRYPPVVCVAEASSAFPAAPVNGSVAAVDDPRIVVGYDDGAVAMCNVEGEGVGVPFIAHARRVSAVCTFFDGILTLTAGNDSDSSLAVFDAFTGRCMARRMLPYVPTFLSRVPTKTAASLAVALSENVCPSENAFVVGGEEGQVEIFRIVVLSPEKLELKLVRRISQRVRGRERAVVQVEYVRDGAVLLALSKNGELRRWRLSAVNASSLSLLPSDSLRVTFTEENIVEMLENELMSIEDARVASVGGVIQAQNVLAAILDEEAIPEAAKDQLVLEFQRSQADMLMKVSQADTKLRRAGRRIASGFAAGLTSGKLSTSATERRLIRAAKRTAAFEMEYATKRHAESVESIQSATLAKLKELLLNCLKGLRGGNANQLDQIRFDAERLGVEEVVD